MSYIPSNLAFVAQSIREAGGLTHFDGVSVASWLGDITEALTAFSEVVNSDASVIRERLYQEDGGESLARVVQSVAVAAQMAQEYGTQWAAAHGERLTRQSEPVAGEEGWDVQAVQGR